ncbi:MAG: signal peptidase II [Anaerolineae bacterium]
MKRIREYAILILLAGSIVALDQWTKWLVRTYIPLGGIWLPTGLEWLSPYARIVHWYNRGAAFGMFQNGNLIFTLLAFVVVGAILYFYPQVERSDWSLRLALGLQLGGAVGNLLDRLTVGQVTDFISVGTFPVFNIADSSITIGVLVLLLGVWLREGEQKKASSNKPGQNP